MIRIFVRAAALLTLLIGTATPAASTVAFTIRGSTLAALDASMNQRVGPNGQTVHDITVIFRYGSGLAILEPMAELLLNNGVSSDPLSIKLTTATNGTITDERIYDNVIVKEIGLPTMDARSREEVNMQIKFEASSLQVGATGGAAPKGSTKFKIITASQFVAVVESLPSTKITRIFAHRILPCAQGGCDSLNRYEVELRGSDVAAWRTWFSKASVDPNYKVDGYYTVTGTDLATPIMRMKLTGMKPVSFAESVDVDGPTARVVFRAPNARPNVY